MDPPRWIARLSGRVWLFMVEPAFCLGHACHARHACEDQWIPFGWRLRRGMRAVRAVDTVLDTNTGWNFGGGEF